MADDAPGAAGRRRLQGDPAVGTVGGARAGTHVVRFHEPPSPPPLRHGPRPARITAAGPSNCRPET